MKYLIILVFIAITMSMASAEYPEEIPAYIEWSFEVEAPKDYSEFISFAREMQSETTRDLPWYSPIKLYLKYAQTNLEKSYNIKRLMCHTNILLKMSLVSGQTLKLS